MCMYFIMHKDRHINTKYLRPLIKYTKTPTHPPTHKHGHKPGAKALITGFIREAEAWPADSYSPGSTGAEQVNRESEPTHTEGRGNLSYKHTQNSDE